MRTIKLAHGIITDMAKQKTADYKVITVKNSTAYHPGQILCKNEVDDLCHNNNWDVTIVGYRPELADG